MVEMKPGLLDVRCVESWNWKYGTPVRDSQKGKLFRNMVCTIYDSGLRFFGAGTRRSKWCGTQAKAAACARRYLRLRINRAPGILKEPPARRAFRRYAAQ